MTTIAQPLCSSFPQIGLQDEKEGNFRPADFAREMFRGKIRCTDSIRSARDTSWGV